MSFADPTLLDRFGDTVSYRLGFFSTGGISVPSEQNTADVFSRLLIPGSILFIGEPVNKASHGI
jgi:hypothetical protein